MKESYKERHCRLQIKKVKVFGRRIDSYLAARFQGYSRNFFQKLIASRKVLINGAVAKNSSTLRSGCEIMLTLPAIDKCIRAEDMPLDIIYEDKWVLAVNKPPYTVVHPARGNLTGTIINAMFGRFRKEIEEIDGFYPKVVHRLDKNTSGALLIGLTEKEHVELARQFERRSVRKIYWAITRGIVNENRASIELPIGFSTEKDGLMAIRKDTGKPSLTKYRVLKRFAAGYTLLEVELKTGRTHQIRIHLSAIGHPIACDRDYGDGEAIFPQDIGGWEFESLEPVLERQALHSRSLEFDHPITGKRIKIEAPLRGDMERLIEMLEENN